MTKKELVVKLIEVQGHKDTIIKFIDSMIENQIKLLSSMIDEEELEVIKKQSVEIRNQIDQQYPKFLEENVYSKYESTFNEEELQFLIDLDSNPIIKKSKEFHSSIADELKQKNEEFMTKIIDSVVAETE